MSNNRNSKLGLFGAFREGYREGAQGRSHAEKRQQQPAPPPQSNWEFFKDYLSGLGGLFNGLGYFWLAFILAAILVAILSSI